MPVMGGFAWYLVTSHPVPGEYHCIRMKVERTSLRASDSPRLSYSQNRGATHIEIQQRQGANLVPGNRIRHKVDRDRTGHSEQ